MLSFFGYEETQKGIEPCPGSGSVFVHLSQNLHRSQTHKKLKFKWGQEQQAIFEIQRDLTQTPCPGIIHIDSRANNVLSPLLPGTVLTAGE